MKVIRVRAPKRTVKFIGSNVTLARQSINGMTTIYPIEYKLVFPWDKEYGKLAER